jgi:hypothetical protein
MSGIIGDNLGRSSGLIKAVGGGKIGQVISATKTATQSFTSASWVAVTGLSVTITPAATSSKILWHYALAGANTGGYTASKMAYGDASDLTTAAIGDAANNRIQSTGGNMYDQTNSAFTNNVAMGIDNPATTSATTYEVHYWQTGGTGYVNRNTLDTDDATNVRTMSSITVMEILA